MAWIHQAVVRRFPFALFRVYAVAVSGGIGSVFGWFFSFWLSSFNLSFYWIIDGGLMLALVGVFGYFAYTGARSLRGTPPEAFAWVSKEEFEGVYRCGDTQPESAVPIN